MPRSKLSVLNAWLGTHGADSYIFAPEAIDELNKGFITTHGVQPLSRRNTCDSGPEEINPALGGFHALSIALQKVIALCQSAARVSLAIKKLNGK